MLPVYSFYRSNSSFTSNTATTVKHKKFLKGRYMPVMILKSDIKGNVYKGISFKKLLSPQWCLIKQGKKGIYLDEHGRDMHDRLIWQQKLNTSISGFIDIPVITDCFIEKEDMFLIMDFIDGETLNDRIDRIYKNQEQSILQNKQLVVSHLIDISENLAQLHATGHVHRDLNPENFLIKKDGKISFIDMELAYSIIENQPNPPFIWGTPGFMSPAQLADSRPCFQDDIYGLGSLMLYSLTGLIPNDCGLPDLTKLTSKISEQINNKSMTELILTALDPNPFNRPSITSILYDLQGYYESINMQHENNSNQGTYN